MLLCIGFLSGATEGDTVWDDTLGTMGLFSAGEMTLGWVVLELETEASREATWAALEEMVALVIEVFFNKDASACASSRSLSTDLFASTSAETARDYIEKF
jgi:hypothetical protein